MCDCVADLNKKLAPYNTQITANLLGPEIFISTCKLDKKKRTRMPLVASTFCPFCGEKHRETDRLLRAEKQAEAA